MTARRRLAAAGLTVALLGGVAPPAHADWIDRLTPPTPEQIAGSIRDLEPRVYDLQPRVRDAVQRRTEGPQEVVDLNADLLFAFARFDVRPAGAARVVELVQRVPHGATVQVYGHTDSIGSDASNLTLSRARADAVAAIIATARPDLVLDVQGFGETRPRRPDGGEDDSEARAQNRRVELRYRG